MVGVGGWLTAMAEDARARGARIEDFMMVSILLIRGAIAWAEERGFVCLQCCVLLSLIHLRVVELSRLKVACVDRSCTPGQ